MLAEESAYYSVKIRVSNWEFLMIRLGVSFSIWSSCFLLTKRDSYWFLTLWFGTSAASKLSSTSQNAFEPCVCVCVRVGVCVKVLKVMRRSMQEGEKGRGACVIWASRWTITSVRERITVENWSNTLPKNREESSLYGGPGIVNVRNWWAQKMGLIFLASNTNLGILISMEHLPKSVSNP